MSELLTLFGQRARAPVAGAQKLGTLRSPASTQLNGLQVYYPLEETSGVRLDAMSGGAGPAALLVRTSTKHLDLADTADLSIGVGMDMTLAGWFLATSNPGVTMTIVSKFNTTDNNREYTLNLVISGSTPVLQWVLSADGVVTTGKNMDVANAIATATWYFACCQYDASRALLKVSLNGGAFETAAHATGIFDGAATFHFGGLQTSGTTQPFDGRIKSWGLWKSLPNAGGLLSAAQITALYNQGMPRRFAQLQGSEKANLVAWWDLSELSGTRSDSVGANHLTDNTVVFAASPGNSLGEANTVTSNTGKVGTAAEFVIANSEQLAAGDSPELRGGDTDWEFAFWVRFAAVATNQTLFAKDNGAAAGREYRCDFLTATAKISWIVYDGTNIIGTVTTTGTFSANTFYYVRVFHDAANNLVGIQVDGGTADTAATTGAPSAGTTQPFRIGANGSGTPQYFGGRIDELGKWGRLRTAGEIAATYAAGSGLAYPLGSGGVL